MFLFTATALALECSGLSHPDVCEAVNELAASVNAQRPGTIADSGVPNRFLTATLYNRLVAVKMASGEGCQASGAFEGWSAGLYNRRNANYTGSSARPTMSVGSSIGAIVKADNTLLGTLDDSVDGPLDVGTFASGYNATQFVADLDTDGFLAGTLIRLNGRTGVFAGLYGSCTTGDVSDFEDWFDGTFAPPPVITNLAPGGVASQVSTGFSGAASRANDGNTDGEYFSGASVAHTASSSESQPWWEVDLGDVYTITEVVVWNRTDCCANRMTNFWIHVSDDPFPGGTGTLAASQAVANYSEQDTGFPSPDRLFTMPPATTGRYVRLQLNGNNFLHAAEVQVFGY